VVFQCAAHHVVLDDRIRDNAKRLEQFAQIGADPARRTARKAAITEVKWLHLLLQKGSEAGVIRSL